MLEQRTSGYIHNQAIADTTWTIVHNRGTMVPIVDIWVNYNSKIVKIVPSNLVATDVNTIVVTFNVAQSGRVMVI